MRSSTDLFFDSRPSPSAASAATLSAADPDLNTDLDINESTSLISNRITAVNYDSARHTVSNHKRLLAQDILEAISILQKARDKWDKTGYVYPITCTSNFYLSATAANIILFPTFLTLTIWFFRKSYCPDLHDYKKLIVVGNTTTSCQRWWPASFSFMRDHCDEPLNAIINCTNMNDICLSIQDLCEKQIKNLCDDFNNTALELALTFGLSIALLGSVVTSLMLLSFIVQAGRVTLNRQSAYVYTDITPVYRDKISPVLERLNITANSLGVIIEGLKEKSADLILDASIEEIQDLENAVISKETALTGDLTYFAALKQDSSLLKSHKQRVQSSANSNQNLGQRLMGLFNTAPQKPQASSAIQTNPVTPLACGNDLNDMIFSYALGRKYSSV